MYIANYFIVITGQFKTLHTPEQSSHQFRKSKKSGYFGADWAATLLQSMQ